MDIDHIYLMSYNYQKGSDGKLTSIFDKEKNPKKWHQNNIMDVLLTLLKDVENSTHSLYKSIDNDTTLAKDIADQIPVTDSDKHTAYNIGTLREQVLRKQDYITGKIGIAPFALNITNQVLTYLYGVKFKDTKFTYATGILRFDKLIDWDGNYIQSWLGAFINGHVDIVKDPWVAKLNANPFTYNTLNLLLRSGFGDVSVWFLCQPIIKDLAQATANAQSNFLLDETKDKSVWKAKERATKQTLLKYFPKDILEASDFSIFTDPKQADVRARAVNYIKINSKALQHIATHPGIEQFTIDGIKYNTKEVQQRVYDAWITLEPYARALGRLVQLTKIDTRKHGKTFIEIRNYLYKYQDTFFPRTKRDFEGSIWDLNVIQRFLKNSWVDKKTREAIRLPFEIMGDQTFEGNDTFIDNVIRMGYILTGGDSASDDMLKKLSRHLITYIKSKYFVGYAKDYLGMTDEDLTAMFVGNRTMATRLNNFIYASLYNDKYKRLAGNRLLSQLAVAVNDKPLFVDNKEVQRPEFITVKDNVNNNKINSRDLRDGWLDLLNDEDQYVRRFARDLIVYAFLSSGEFKGWNKLLKYIPPQFIKGEIDQDYQSFSDFIRESLQTIPQNYPEEVLDEIVSNNSDDFNFVTRFDKDDIVAHNEAALIVKPIDAETGDTIEELPPYVYIKNEKQSSYCRDSKALYKFVGTILHNEQDYPVYVRMRHSGYHNQNTDIYQYGWKFDYIENNPKILEGLDQSTIVERAARYLSYHPLLEKDFFDFFKQFAHELYTEDPQPPVVVTGGTQDSYTLHSGGAIGSDSYWGEVGARYYGVTSRHYYTGERSEHNAPLGNVEVSPKDYEEGRIEAAKAAARNWDYDKPKMSDPRLIRNWSQVKYADAIFAVGHVVQPGERIFPNIPNDERVATNPSVTGGTGYAVGMAILHNKPVYVFDQDVEKWYTWDDSVNNFVETDTPTLTRNFAGIGTRGINEAGKQAIRDVYNNTFGESQPPQPPTNPVTPPVQQLYVETASAVIERATLESDKTILSNEELAVWNEAGVGDNPRILVATEHSDPAFHSEQIISVIEGKTKVKQSPEYVDITKEEYDSLPKNQRWHNQATDKYFRIKERPQITGKDFAGLYIITKHDGLPLLNLLKTDIPKLIHFSITGLGSTKWEPGSMKPDDLLDRIHDYIKQGLDPNAVTVRIDPIVPGVTTPRMIEHIVQRASEMGIKRIRFSIMDTYGNTVRKMTALGYDFNNKYHWGEEEKLVKGRVIRVKKLLPNDDVVNSICDFMLKMKDKYGVTLGTCAENIHREGISNEGCLSVEGVNRMLGTSIEDKGTDNNKQRLLCSCYGGKVDALAYDDYCGTSCTYCYGKHENDAVHQYYNPDGILKYGTYEDDMLIASRSFVLPNTGIPQNRNGFDINDISDKTEAYGVQIDPELKDNFEDWQEDNPNGIVAYRVPFKTYDTVENVRKGRIGNPFSEGNSRGPETVQYFYDWLVGGINPDPVKFPKATEEFRQAIVDKIKSTPKGSPILYYKELGRPSHATVIGYLIANYGKDPRETRLNILKESAKPTKTTFTFKDGTTVDAPFEVNDEQEAALNSMLDFVKSDETHMTLSGYAGTGKTSIVEILARKLNNDFIKVKFCATTNTAAQILTSKVRKAGYTASTVHSTFGVQVAIDESSDVYDASNRVQQEGKVEIANGSVIIIDESSMINENIYNIINKAVSDNNAKVIYMGDPAQLPPVGETKISIIFRNTTGKIVNLTKVERTGDNAILREATAIRNGEPLSKESSFNSEGKGVAFVQRGHKDIIKNIVETFAKKLSDNSNFFKILTYSNQSVSNYNIATRNALEYTDPYPIEGEPIVGYQNWGYIGRGSTRKYQFMNSESYVVVRRDAVVDASCEGISLQVAPVLLQNEFGYQVLVNVVDVKNNSKNKDAVRELCAKKQELWKQWRVTKNRFYIKQVQNIEKFLFVNDDVFDTNPDAGGHLPLLQPKVFDYGYAITVHKSQGSTYTHVLIDDYNIVNTSGYHAKSAEQAKEYIQQLEYVAVSRATDTATVLTTSVKKEDSPLNHTDLQSSPANLSSQEVKINIYAGSGENVELSNFAHRPFIIKGSVIGAPNSNEDYKFDSVEHAFQAAKTMYSDAEDRDEWFDRIQKAKTPAEARSLGKKIPELDAADWDRYSSEIMKDLIKLSFQQNPQALQKLLDTGGATLTHVQDKGKWGKEFPRILMQVRSELASEQREEQNNPISTPSSPIQIYSDGSDIKGTGAIGYGAVFKFKNNMYGLSGTETSEEVSKLKQMFPDAKFSNPTMEMLALATTLEHFANLGIAEHLEINQDYKGAVNYGKLWNYSEGSNQREAKPWNAKEPYIKHLVERSENAIETIVNNGGSVKINWVKGHQSAGTEQARMNDAADSYAKNRTNFNTIDDVYKQNNNVSYSDIC